MNTQFERSLRDHLASVDHAPVSAGSEVLAASARAGARRAQKQRRAAVGGVVALVALAGAGLSMAPFDQAAPATLPVGTAATSTSPTTVAPSTSLGPQPTPGPGWMAVPPDPRGVTRDADVLWTTGSVALMIGGVDDTGQPRDGVAEFDPFGTSWRVLSTAPIPLISPVFVSAGADVVAVGLDAEQITAVATFDPATGEWTPGPQSPVSANVAAQPWVWTGSELLIATNQGSLAYDVPNERWRLLAPFPLAHRTDATSVWTGAEWIVWGGQDLDDLVALGDGAAYDPATDRWRLLSKSPLGPRLVEGVWTGSEVLIVGGRSGNSNGMMAYGDGAAYAPATDSWRSLASGPAHPGFAPVWTGTLLVGFFKGGAVAYDPALDEWVFDFAGSGLPHLDRAPTWTGTHVLLLGSYDHRIGGAMFNPERPG
jgi:hypothetical protein